MASDDMKDAFNDNAVSGETTDFEAPLTDPVDFRVAVINGNNEDVAAFLKRHPDAIDRVGDSDMTALMAAVWFEKKETVKLLLKLGANANKQTPASRWTALMVAAVHGNRDMIELLLEKDADPEIKNSDDRKAVTYVSPQKDPEIVELLENWPAIKRARFLAEDCARGVSRDVPAKKPFRFPKKGK